MVRDKVVCFVWFFNRIFVVGFVVGVVEFKGTVFFGFILRIRMRKRFFDFFIIRDGIIFVLCVCVLRGCGVFLVLLCFYVLDVEYLKIIIGNGVFYLLLEVGVWFSVGKGCVYLVGIWWFI